MSDLTALQPTIFFASCTLKGLLWIPFTLLPELFLKPTNNDSDEEEDHAFLFDQNENNQDKLLLLQDHHVLLAERICHYTNIFLLLGLIAFYAVNPRLWKYRHYGWFLTCLLLLQHIPQQLRHDGWWGQELDTDTDTDTDTATLQQVLYTNRIFSTIGVVIVQLYCCYYGHGATVKRWAAEPFFVFGAIMTLLLETHLTCAFVWIYQTTHPSTSLSYTTRQYLCAGILAGILLPLALWHRRVHAAQAKQLRRQLKTLVGQQPKNNNNNNNNNNPKMKFV